MKSLYAAGEHFTTDEGVTCEVLDVLSWGTYRVRRLDAGEAVYAAAERRRPPKGWAQVRAADVFGDGRAPGGTREEA